MTKDEEKRLREVADGVIKAVSAASGGRVQIVIIAATSDEISSLRRGEPGNDDEISAVIAISKGLSEDEAISIMDAFTDGRALGARR